MKTKVAMVEDDAGFRVLLEQFVNDAPGLRCVGAFGNAEDGLKKIPGLEPDVVLMDIRLPNLSGIEATVRLRKLLPKTPVLMLTVNTDPESVFNALKAGAKGYLLKSTVPTRLLPAIQELLQGGSPMSGEIARQVVDFFQTPAEPEHPEMNLTRREREVIDLLARGYTDKEIGQQLNLSYETVRSHCSHIYDKIHVRSRTEAVLKYLKHTNAGPTASLV